MRNVSREFLFGMVAGAAILAVGMLLGGWTGGQETIRDLQVRRLEVVDAAGTSRLVLGTNDHGGSLSLKNRFGRSAVVIGATEIGGTVAVKNTQRHVPAVVMTAGAEGGLAAVYLDNGDAAGELSGTRTGGAMRLRSRVAGKTSVMVDTTEGGRGRISTWGPHGKRLVAVTATGENDGQIYTMSGDGRPLVALASTESGPAVQLVNRQGEVVATIEADGRGEGRITVLRNGLHEPVATEPIPTAKP